MNPQDFLDVAGELVGGGREADWRTAASRAYYSAFHVARTVLRQCGFVPPQGDQAHTYLSLRLANTGHPNFVQAGNDLSYLRTVRNRADYGIEHEFAHQLALDHLQLAIDVVQALELLSTDPVTRQEITDAIRIYERDVLKQITWRP